jgi:hypothetical protein
MKHFLIKSSSIFFVVILLNFSIGIIRLFNADPALPYSINRSKEFINTNQKYGRVNLRNTSKRKEFKLDLSGEVIVKYNFTDVFDSLGFRNFYSNKNPEILFIGDSFFDDPYISAENGLNSKVKNSMNISTWGETPGLGIYNNLKEKGYFNRIPKFIFFEVSERKAERVLSGLYLELISNEYKVKKYEYYYADLIFGANFKDLKVKSVLGSKAGKNSTKSQIEPVDIDGSKVYFRSRKINKIKVTAELINSVKNVVNYFRNLNCEVVFVIAPDKESFYPELFGETTLSLLHKTFLQHEIGYIDMYNKIYKQPDFRSFYHRGDTHWNEKAFELLINEINRFVDMKSN